MRKHRMPIALLAVGIVLFIAVSSAVGSSRGRKPFGRVNSDTVEAVLFTYKSAEGENKQLEVVDKDITDESGIDFILERLDEMRIYSKYADQEHVIDDAHIVDQRTVVYTLKMKSGDTYVIDLVGVENNIEYTGYYFSDEGKRKIMKKGTPEYLVRIDGVLYDIRSERVYLDLRDMSNGYKK